MLYLLVCDATFLPSSRSKLAVDRLPSAHRMLLRRDCYHVESSQSCGIKCSCLATAMSAEPRRGMRGGLCSAGINSFLAPQHCTPDPGFGNRMWYDHDDVLAPGGGAG
eukprot:6205521-Pleurochrysis_carterae.AAC.1